MRTDIRHTQGFSCAPGSTFFARCQECKRLLLFGQTCVCGTPTNVPTGPRERFTAMGAPETGAVVESFLARYRARESAPRGVCSVCQFEYTSGTDKRCEC